jgi:ribosomal-protein-alanine N-acetyltransferase
MVARPPVKVTIAAMRLDDLEIVQAIERGELQLAMANRTRTAASYETNRLANYLVARADGEIVGYGGMWLMVDEAHITTFAVHPAWRRQRIGERLLLAFLDLAVARQAHEATLEVRLSNLPARRLYEKYGFRPVGLRPRYYSDDNEDALIMTTEPLAEPRMRERLQRLRAELETAPLPRRPASPTTTRAHRTWSRAARNPNQGNLRERTARARARVVVRRGRASRSWRMAGGSTRTWSPRRSRSTRRPAGSCRRWPRAPTCAGWCR